MKIIKGACICILLAALFAIFASAVTAPEVYGDVSIRTEKPVGMRATAFIETKVINNIQSHTTEYGFIVTRKVFLKGAGLTNDEFSFDSNVFYIKGIAYGIVDGERVNHFFDINDTDILFGGYFYGITEPYYREVYVARPYTVSGKNVYYGKPVELCLYDEAKKLQNDTEAYEGLTYEQKVVIDEIVNAYAPQRENYRIVVSAESVENYDGTFSINYTLFNPFTGKIEDDCYIGRGCFKGQDLMPSINPGTVVALVDGLVEDVYGTVADIRGDNLYHISSMDIQGGSMSLVKLDDSVKCKDCINEAVQSYDGGFTDIYGICTYHGSLTIDENTPVSVIYGDIDTLFSNGTYAQTTLERIASRETDFLCYNYGENGEKLYSDYIKAFVSVDENGECEYIIVVVNGNENAALDEKCHKHTPIVYHNVNFYVGEEKYDSQAVENASYASLPENPYIEDKKFAGWAVSENATPDDVVDIGSYIIESDTDFHAVWINCYTVEFVSDNNAYYSSKVLDGSCSEVPKAPVMEDREFLGWTVFENGTKDDIINVAEYIINADTRFYAVWLNYFMVEFVSEGEVYHTAKVADSECAEAPKAPSLEDYGFVGWSVLENGTENDIVNVSEYPVTGTTRFYAVFKRTHALVTFMVNGVEYSSVKAEIGKAPTIPEEPVFDDAYFKGWALSSDASAEQTVDVSAYAVQQETVFYAVVEYKQNDPNLIEILTRGNAQLKKIRIVNGSKHDVARDLLVECITYVLADANNGVYISETYIRKQYPELSRSIRDAIKVDMTKEERSSFVSILTNTKNIDKDVQDFLVDYFNIDLSAI